MKKKATYLTLSLLLCLCISVFSNSGSFPPPDNDLCAGAIDLGVIECEFYAEYDADPEATADAEATGNCIDNTEPAQWYTFTTSDPLEYGTLQHFSSDAKIEIFTTTSDCSDLVYVDCGIGPFGFKPEPATTYYYLTTGNWHLQPPSSGLSSCDDVLTTWNFTQSPLVSSSYTDCAAPSADVNCQNDHVIWFEYTVGCGESSDVLIDVGPFSNDPSITANELSITAALFDCSTLLSEYDENGLGYVCSAIGAGESINLIDVPPGLSIAIGIGSDDYNAGYFDIFITETTNIGTVSNDECIDAEPLDTGINTNLSNSCAMPDMAIPGCGPQSEATVWYEYDQGNELQTLLITLLPISIENPAIAIYDACSGDIIESICGTSLELTCIDFPIIIQIGSSLEDAGLFDLDIENASSLPPIEPIITGGNICSEELAGITIDIPGGEIVDITVEVAPWSSLAIAGMTNQSFLGVNTATINDILFNSSSTAQEAIYLITVSAPDGYCPAEQIEYSIMVYPGFTVNEYSLDECLPYILDIDVSQLITGGTLPYASTTWYWNSTDILGTDQSLTVDLEESGVLTLEVVDGAGCSKSATIDIELTPTVTPTFNFPLNYCRSKHDLIVFPLISIEEIPGSWSTPFIDLDVFLNDGTYDIIFTADDPHCIVPVVLSIQIHSGDDPVFDLPDIICSDELEYEFPTEDLNGLMGTWEIPIMDVSSISGEQSNIFTPISEDCYAPFEYIFEIPESFELDFGQPETLCRLDQPYTLNNLSLEGFEGTWDVPIIDPNLVSGSSISSTWTPLDGQFPCFYEKTITIQIIDPLLPQFSLPNELCALDENYTLPTIDDQSISGTWSVPIIAPNESIGIIQSIFTPDDPCIEIFTWDIEILEPEIPEFDLELELCTLDDVLTLPLVSDNGIPGNWTPATIDPSMIGGQQVMIEFRGADTEFCVQPVELLFDIIAAEDPIFDISTRLCWQDADVILPINSDNGIEGIWSPAVIDVQSNLGAIVSSTFSPIDGSCSNEEFLTFEIIASHIVDPIVTDPSDCAIEDGSIFLDIIQGDNLEFSIDNGFSWQSSNLFSFLGSGGFTILVRSADLNHCSLSVEAFLSSPDGPVINEVSSTDISNCSVDNGSIVVDADGNNLEYSIDGGITWQSSNSFDNLSEGDYLINIREVMSDCVVEVGAMIMDFPQTEIVMVNTQDLSDCNMNDGQIEIVAEGEALEYSIDNGASWSTQNTFNNLTDGNYIIVVQSMLGEDCDVSTAVDLIAPSVPEIIVIDIGNPTQCAPIIGRIDIEAQGSNLEFSIDGGLMWQDDGAFPELEAGIYHVMIRDSLRVNCFDEVMVEIMLEEESLPESVIDVSPPSICDAPDARIELSNALMDIEYSIDGGQSWQTSNIFDNLLPGSYEIIIRKILLPDCMITQAIEVPNTNCPCNDLSLEFETSNISCTGMASGRVELTLIEGMKDSDINIEWRDGGTEQFIEGVDEGWQVVTIYYDDDCIWTDSVWVDLIQPIQFEWNTENQDCPEIDNGKIEITNVSGGNGNYEYSIDGSLYQTEYLFQGLYEGEYQVYVRDDAGCLTVQSAEVHSNPKLEIYLADIDSIFVGESVILDPGIDLMGIDSFAWSPIVDIQNPNELIVVVSPSITTIYTLDVYYGECIESREILIKVFPKEEVHIGNVFSPNRDNNNDVLYIQGVPNSTIALEDFSIYDRWGNLIFQVSQPEFNNKSDGWDGRFRNKNVAPGVYVYQVNYLQDNQLQVKIGTVTVLY